MVVITFRLVTIVYTLGFQVNQRKFKVDIAFIHRRKVLGRRRYATISQWNLGGIEWIIPSHTESITTIPRHVFLHGRDFVDHIWHGHR